jgi:glyoxalase superfamily protein
MASRLSPGRAALLGHRRSWASRPEAALTAPLPGQAGGRCEPWALRWPRVTEAVERLAAAEATVIRGNAQNGIPDHVVMTDPEGNEFCVL